MAHRLPDNDTTTQCQHPHRAVARSSLAAAVGTVPILWPLVNRELGPVWATVAVVGRMTLDQMWHAVPSFPTASEVWLRLLEASLG